MTESTTSPNAKSPGQWRSPADVMKLRRLKSKKKVLDMRMKLAAQHVDVARDVTSTPSEPLRSNPFRCSPYKRRRRAEDGRSSSASSSDLSSDVSCDSSLFELLQTPSATPSPNVPHLTVGQRCSSGEDVGGGGVGDHPAPAVTRHRRLPFDWSLKTALRFISVQPFPWNSSRLSTVEQASGISGYVRCVPLHDDARQTALALDTSPNAQMLQCCQVWMHPALPWLKLFPRHQTGASAPRAAATNLVMSRQMHESMQADWAESFQSLFHLVRARQCPFFYVCAPSFTALFRAPGVGANPRLHALITPTTRGFRSALTKEGVHFTLPLFKADEQSSCSTDPDDDLNLHDEEDGGGQMNLQGGSGDSDTREDVVDWLKSVGVEDKMLAQLDNDMSSSFDKTETDIDHRHASLVCIEEGNVHALFNFFLNSKSCVANSGPLVGIPPTLLAPVAYTGATLRPLKIRQQRAEKYNIFDVVGPILPHTLHYLDHLLKVRSSSATATGTGSGTLAYEVRLSTLEPTVPFSMYSLPANGGDAPPPPTAFGQQSLSDCGLAGDVLESMCSRHHGDVLRHVTVDAGQYQWTP